MRSVSRVVRVASCALVCVAALVEGREIKAEPAVYTNVAPDAQLKEWLVLGPIHAVEKDGKPDGQTARKVGYRPDLLKEVGGETEVEPQIDVSVNVRGDEYKWKHYAS